MNALPYVALCKSIPSVSALTEAIVRAATSAGPILLAVATLGFTAPSLWAQATLTGQVQDESGMPISMANVQLLAAADSALVQGTTADSSGTFRLGNVDAGRYKLHVSLIGYQDHLSAAFTVREAGQQSVEPVTLATRTIEMEGLTVDARRSLYEQRGDRLIINVGTSITLSGATALDVLKRSPGVVVNEQSSTISMLGKDGVRVLINGKRSYLPAQALTAYLSGVSAANIERVELITAPPAEFDAEGNAGFINLVLKQRPDDGLTGSLTASGGYGRGEVTTASGDVSYQRGAVSLLGSYSFLWNGQLQRSSNLRRITVPAPATETSMFSRRDRVQRNHNLRVSLDYQAGERTTIGAVVAGYDNRWSMDALSHMTTAIDRAPATRVRSDNDEVNHWQHLMGNVNMRRRLGGGRTVSIDLDHLRYNNENPTEYHNTSTDVASGQATDEVLSSGKTTPLHITVAKVDYRGADDATWTINAGVKGAFSQFTNDPTFSGLVSAAWLGDTVLGGKTDLREDVLAAYGSIRYQLSDGASANVGLRYELTDSHLGSKEAPNLVDRRFGSLFPSVTYTHELSNEVKANASYTRRITRPSFNDMAPYLYFFDPSTLLTGNAAIQPALINTLKMDLTARSVLASVQYAWEDSSIAQFQSRVIPDENVQLILPANQRGTKTVTALLAAPLSMANWWTTQNNATLIWQEIDGFRFGEPFAARHTSVRLNTTHTVSLPRSFTVEGTGFYQGPMLFGTMRFERMWDINVALQHTLPGRSGQLTLAVDNVFETSNWAGEQGSPRDPIHIRWTLELQHRTVKLTYTRRFGDGSSSRRATASEEESARVQ